MRREFISIGGSGSGSGSLVSDSPFNRLHDASHDDREHGQRLIVNHHEAKAFEVGIVGEIACIIVGPCQEMSALISRDHVVDFPGPLKE